MKIWIIRIRLILFFLSVVVCAQEHEFPFKHLKTFKGNTHAHTFLTYSHGNHLKRTKDYSKDNGDKMLYIDSLFLSRPNKAVLKDDWELFQGLPAKHYEEAKKAGYDFYFVTDHSQEEAFFPYYKNNTAWSLAMKQAETATEENFTALMGVEHSENDSYNTRVHLNVIGPSSYLNALRPEVDLPYFYDWLEKNPKNQITGYPVVVQFNHPIKGQFNDFVYRDDDVTDIITILEVVNGSKIHYVAYVEALDNGWKVSPSAGLDNHNFTAIALAQPRTFVLAENNTPGDILNAMRKRRTYASLDKNLECRYTVNDSLMGSTVDESKTYKLYIHINDPDVTDESDRISKIEVITGNGKIIKTIESKAFRHRNYWSVSLKNKKVSNYLFVRVWDNLKDNEGDISPVAWLSPVWIKK